MSISRSDHRPVHFYVAGTCYFLTAAALRHQPFLAASERRDRFVALLVELVAEFRGELVAWVILSDHDHAVIRVPEADTVPRLAQTLHRRSARQFNEEDRTPDRQVG